MLNGGPLVELKTAQTVQTQDRFDLTIAGNTVGVGQLISSGTVTIAGGNNVTLSQVGNGITISAGSAGAAFSAGVSGLSNDSGTLGTVSNLLVIAGGNNITLSQSINAGSATITIIGGAGGAGTTFSAGVSNLSNDSGSTGTVTNQIVFAGGNNITLSQSSNVGGYATVTVIGPNTVAQSVQTQGMVSINGSTGAIVLTAGNNITLSENLSTITISGPNTVAQSVQPAVAEINGTSGTFSIVQGNLISLSNNLGTITISNILSSSAIAVDVSSASSQGSLTARFAMADHAHRGLGVIYASGANGANSFYGPMTIATGNANITLSTGASGLSIHGPTPGAGVAIADWIGNTITNNSVVFSFSNNVYFRLTGSTMTASVFVPAIGVSTGGNTCNTTGIFDIGSIVLQGGNNITLCMTTATNYINTIEIIGPGGANLSYFENFGGINLQPFTPGTHTGGANNIYISYQRIYVPANLVVDEVDMIFAISGDSNSSGAFTISGCFYSFSLSSSSSVSSFFGSRTTSFYSTVVASLITTLKFSNAISWTSGSDTSAYNQYANASGTQYFPVTFSQSVGTALPVTVTQGEYLFAFMVSQNMPAASLSIYGLSSLNIDSIGNAFPNNQYFHKGYISQSNISTSGLSMPLSIVLSEITQNGSSVLAQPYFFMARGQLTGSTTGTY